MNTVDRVSIQLTKAEALVLFDLLSRFSEHESLAICDQAEERVLWNMHADLEKAFTEPLQPEYRQLLQSARDAVRNSD